MSIRHIKTLGSRRTFISQYKPLLTIGVVQAAPLEEVIVKAQKREQNLQFVVVAVTAFTRDQLSTLGVTVSFDITGFSSGVHINGNLADPNAQFTIRSVTQNDFNNIVEALNTVYLDERYLAISQAQTFAVFDVDRVVCGVS